MRGNLTSKAAKLTIVFVTLLAAVSIFVLKPKATDTEQKTVDALRSAHFNEKYQAAANEALAPFAGTVDAKQGLVMILSTQTGSVEAFSGYDVSGKDPLTLVNQAYEPGSIMKPLTLAAALNESRLKTTDRYVNPGFITVDHHIITNVQETGYEELTVQDIIKLSLNTGAVSLLESLSDEKKIDNQSIRTWQSYLTDNYRLGKPTGLNIPGEAPGFVPSLQPRVDRDYTFAGTTFGFSMTATPVQLLSTYAALVNGGTYYQPYFRGLPNELGQPASLRQNVISNDSSLDIKDVLAKTFTFQTGRPATINGYAVGAKSGTAPSIMPDGNYNPYRDVGSYIGYFEKGRDQYVMLVRLNEPRNNKLASKHAGELWFKIVDRITQ